MTPTATVMKTIKEACQKLKAHSCSSYEYTDDGFKAHYDNNGKENLMFFSVPYSDGFTAYVNGEEADVEKVNYGFMAVKIPQIPPATLFFITKHRDCPQVWLSA